MNAINISRGKIIAQMYHKNIAQDIFQCKFPYSSEKDVMMFTKQ